MSCTKQPDANFTCSNSICNTGETISFTNNSLDAESYEWDFGDGTSSTSTAPIHTYYNPGTYYVNLTAYSKNRKKTATATSSIVVNQETTLSIKVVYVDSNSPVSNCRIKVFVTDEDWWNLTNSVASGYTDSNGTISFTGAEPIVYYIDAYKEAYGGFYCNWDLGYITNPIVPYRDNAYLIEVKQ